MPSAESRKDRAPVIPGSAAWLIEHGISEAVYDAQGIERYTAPDELGPVRSEFADCVPNQIEWAENQARKSGSGLVMPKHAITGMGLLPIPPQLRPDRPRVSREPPHHHPLTPSDEPAMDPRKGKRKHTIPDDRCWTAWQMRRHILGSRGHHPEALEAAARRGFDTAARIAELLDDHAQAHVVRAILEEAADSFAAPHQTVSEGKYLLTIGPEKPWRHDHAIEYAGKPDKLSKHEQVHHLDGKNGGAGVIGEHDHTETRATIPDRDPRRNPGKRININPLALERLDAADFVFFGIEGTIKGCAMLTAIIEGDLPASVFDVPSIGQWNAEELPSFVPRLIGKRVIIVPDADGRTNAQVMNQAKLLQARLGYLGIDRHKVHIAAPPDDRDDRGELKWKGVDDFLGVDKYGHKGNILDLQVVGEGFPWLVNFRSWQALHGSQHRSDAAERDYRVFEGLIRLGGQSGKIQTSLKAVARFINESDDDVRLGFRKPMTDDAIERAVKHLMPEWIESDLPLSLRRWTRKTDRYVNRELDWSDGRPTILIRHAGLRMFPLKPTPIGDLVGWTPEQRAHNRVPGARQDHETAVGRAFRDAQLKVR